MTKNFKSIDYLISGNERQKKAHSALVKLAVFDLLKKYNPLLTGTIPIEIDLPESDLDIICSCKNHEEFSALLIQYFGQQANFSINTTLVNGIISTVARFNFQQFAFEIFGQNIPSEKQNAYRHMLVEHAVLMQKGAVFKNEIIKLKSQGIKTEPAFAQLLGLAGNPYEALLKITV